MHLDGFRVVKKLELESINLRNPELLFRHLMMIATV